MRSPIKSDARGRAPWSRCRISVALPVCLAAVVLLGAAAVACAEEKKGEMAGGKGKIEAGSSHAGSPLVGDHADFDSVLGRFNHEGWLDYAALKGDPGQFDRYISDLARLDSAALDKAPSEERLAFYINAYNAITIHIILEHYPIKRRSFFSLYPGNSIRQIDGVFNKIRTSVAGRPLTLDDIEHRILRKEFKEPRIHFALVCASQSCPALADSAFRGSEIDKQLDLAARRFLTDRTRNRFDPVKRQVELSRIFKWYGEDFAGFAAADGRFEGHPAPLDSILSALVSYNEEFRRADSQAGRPWSVRYLSYDWTLNDYAPRRDKGR